MGEHHEPEEHEGKAGLQVHAEIAALWRRMLGAGAFQVLVFGLGCAFVALYASHALAADVDGKVDAGVAPLAETLKRHDAEIAQLKEQVADATRVTLETNVNVRLLVESMGRMPVTLRRGPTIPPGWEISDAGTAGP